jgi:hypothetical protein
MTQQGIKNDIGFSGAMSRISDKRSDLSPGSIFKKIVNPVLWISNWDRNGLRLFVRKWYLGGF